MVKIWELLVMVTFLPNLSSGADTPPFGQECGTFGPKSGVVQFATEFFTKCHGTPKKLFFC